MINHSEVITDPSPTDMSRACLSFIIGAYNLKKGRQFVAGDPSNRRGQVVFAEGKVGVITATADNFYCKILYSDGSTNKKMDIHGWGCLQFANEPGENCPVERVWVME